MNIFYPTPCIYQGLSPKNYEYGHAGLISMEFRSVKFPNGIWTTKWMIGTIRDGLMTSWAIG
jgi:hypothetical protein